MIVCIEVVLEFGARSSELEFVALLRQSLCSYAHLQSFASSVPRVMHLLSFNSCRSTILEHSGGDGTRCGVQTAMRSTIGSCLIWEGIATHCETAMMIPTDVISAENQGSLTVRF